jgi:DNA-binding MarR family transcriptional regulator
MSKVTFGHEESGAAEAERPDDVERLIPSDPGSPHESRSAQMARCTVFLGKQAEIALAEVGISDAQYRMLSLLSRGTVSSSTAATLLSVSPPSITSIIEGLLERGLVERCSAADDKRRVELSLTEAGNAQLLVADDAVARRLEEIASHAGDQDRTEASFDALVWWSDGLRRMAAALSL